MIKLCDYVHVSWSSSGSQPALPINYFQVTKVTKLTNNLILYFGCIFLGTIIQLTAKILKGIFPKQLNYDAVLLKGNQGRKSIMKHPAPTFS